MKIHQKLLLFLFVFLLILILVDVTIKLIGMSAKVHSTSSRSKLLNDYNSYLLSNSVLDCNYRIISGSLDEGSIGLHLSGSNITIKNCIIEHFATAILIENSDNINITNNVIRNSKIAVWAHKSNNLEIKLNNVTNISKIEVNEGIFGIWLSYTNNSIIAYNRVWNSNGDGITVDWGNNNLVYNNTVWDNGNNIVVYGKNKLGNIIKNNMIFDANGSKSWGSGWNIMLIDGTSNNIVQNNVIYGSGLCGICQQKTIDNKFSNNKINDTSFELDTVHGFYTFP